jgi:Trk K+ transport system NAD-binding subunit
VEVKAMKIGILGTGTVGRAHAERLVELRHDVLVGTRNVQRTRARRKRVINLGALDSARAQEALIQIWIELYEALRTSEFGFRIVK